MAVLDRCAIVAGPVMTLVYAALLYMNNGGSAFARRIVGTFAPELVQPMSDVYQQVYGAVSRAIGCGSIWDFVLRLAISAACIGWLICRSITERRARRDMPSDCSQSVCTAVEPHSHSIGEPSPIPAATTRTERGARRRQYLMRKAGAATRGMAGAVLALGGGYLAVMLGISTVHFLSWQWEPALAFGFLAVTVTIVVVYVSFVSVSSLQEARTLPYVPPVRNQTGALPASEVLLRGANPPSATPEELLRAAHLASASESSELLRPC